MSIATSGSPSKTSSPKIKKEAIIRVYGFVMMQKVDEGSYRIKYLSGDVGKTAYTLTVGHAIDYIVNDIYWDERGNWAGADRAEVRVF